MGLTTSPWPSHLQPNSHKNFFPWISCVGKLWGYELYGVEPDIMTLAKPLAGGLPIGAALMKQHVADAMAPGGLPWMAMLGSHGGWDSRVGRGVDREAREICPMAWRLFTWAGLTRRAMRWSCRSAH